MTIGENGEIWKDVEGYEGHYQVSNFGRVRRIRTRLLQPGKNKQGYSIVVLCVGEQRRTVLVHRLVAKAFVPNPRNVDVVNHLDEQPSNNRADNLEWCTLKENTNYGTSIQRMSESLKRYYKNHPPHNAKPVRCVELDIVYPTAAEAEKRLGISRKQISACVTGIHHTAGGYHWEFADKTAVANDLKAMRKTAKAVKEINNA